MATYFDTLAFAQRVEGSGVDRQQAEAHATAVRDYVMKEIVTRTELQEALDRQSMLLTARFGTVVAAGVSVVIGVLGILIKLH